MIGKMPIYTQREIQLTLCECCNLNCIYCYEHNKDRNSMTFNLAKKIITEEFTSAKEKGVTFIKLYFHGGEVCLVFDLLKEICEWVWSKQWNVAYICNATTNGTLVHGAIKQWFKDNSHRFVLGLSLDGDKRMHDLNRNNSYDSIDLNFFKETWPKQEVKMTISPQTIKGLCNGIIDIVSKGFFLSANLAYGCDWEHEDLKYQYAKELFALSNFFLDHPHLEPPRKLMNKWLVGLGRSIFLKEFSTPQKQCGTGSGMCCYDMYGNKYPCQMFMSSSSSKYKYDGYIVQNKDIQYSNECIQCPLVSVCPTCYGYSFTQYGILIKQKDNMCDFYKIELFNYTYFFYEMIKNVEKYSITKKLDKTELALSINALVSIQRSLKNSNVYKYCSI